MHAVQPLSDHDLLSGVARNFGAQRQQSVVGLVPTLVMTQLGY